MRTACGRVHLCEWEKKKDIWTPFKRGLVAVMRHEFLDAYTFMCVKKSSEMDTIRRPCFVIRICAALCAIVARLLRFSQRWKSCQVIGANWYRFLCRGNGLGHLSSESGLDMGVYVNFRLRFDEELYLATMLCTLLRCCSVVEEEEEEKRCRAFLSGSVSLLSTSERETQWNTKAELGEKKLA